VFRDAGARDLVESLPRLFGDVGRFVFVLDE
jgi:hypothetical protein